MDIPASRIEKLTDRERECLRGILDHKTAKEMAIDLGISHHAVEKRLKRAREKLDVATSLEAARLLETGYGRTVSGSSDLSPNPHSRPSPLHRRPGRRVAIAGVFFMLMMTIVAAVSLIHPLENAKAADAIFTMRDADGSGYIEQSEYLLTNDKVVTAIKINKDGSAEPMKVNSPAIAEALVKNFNRLDTNNDGKLSKEEFDLENRIFTDINLEDLD